MLPIDFGRITGPESSRAANFELLVACIVRRKFAGATHIDGAGGDGGVDVMVSFPGTRCVDVYQAKYFLSALTRTQHRQIERSLRQAALGESLRRWVLVTPVDPTRHTKRWFDGLREQYPGIRLEWCGRTELLDILAAGENADLAARFFPDAEAAAALIPALPATVAPPASEPEVAGAARGGGPRTLRVAPELNAAMIDNATLRFALRALDLRETGSRFDTIHIACLQQLVEALVLHDAVLLPALDRRGWSAEKAAAPIAPALHLMEVPAEWDELLRHDAQRWLEEWMGDATARGLIARLLHIQRAEWERKGITLTGLRPVRGMGPAEPLVQSLWAKFVDESSRQHVTGPGGSGSRWEWEEWLKLIHAHGVSLLYWMIFRPFYYHLLAGWVWEVPYLPHPTRGMALAFDALERRRQFSDVALSMVAGLHRDFSSWANAQLGQRLFSAELPPIFRRVLNEAATPAEILPAAMALRESREGRSFREWTRRMTTLGARSPNTIHQACIGLARFAQEVRIRWGIQAPCRDRLYGVRMPGTLPAGAALPAGGTRTPRPTVTFLRRLADSIQSVSELSALYDKHFWSLELDADEFDAAYPFVHGLEVERTEPKHGPRQRRKGGTHVLAVPAPDAEPRRRVPRGGARRAWYVADQRKRRKQERREQERREADRLAAISYGWGY